MNLNTNSPLKVLLYTYIIFLFFSCSKDSDLFDEYVLGDSETDIENRVTEDTEETNTSEETNTDTGSNKADQGPLKAFPSAYGAASNATGGRGGSVYVVSNLNNSGPGSFRDAVSQSNRIIVFEVSGTIDLTSNLTITADNLTIAGQSAPPGGIALTGRNVYLNNANNIIIRFLRFRPDYNSNGIVDAVNIYDCDDVVMDHCSISWGGDEAISIIGNSARWTFSNNIIGESATGMLAGDSNSLLSSDISIHNNLWYNISHRFPNANASRVDVINNVVHNWKTRIMVVSSNDNVKLNEIGNYYQRGERPMNVLDASQHAGNWLDIRDSPESPKIRIYSDGNMVSDVLSDEQDSWALYRHRFDVKSGPYAGIKQWDLAHVDFKSNNPYTLLGESFPLVSARLAKTEVETNSGAFKTLDGSGNVISDWDSIDETYLDHVRNNTIESYSYPPTSITSKQSYRDYQSRISSEPINIRLENYDTDKDGMPDAWEISTFGNLTRNGSGDIDADGYTDLEEYLNLVDFSN